MSFQLLAQFQSLFEGHAYLHRKSTQGDYVSQFVFEDLLTLNHSPKLTQRIEQQRCVLNVANKTHGIKHRRGDGSFGTLIPGDAAIADPGFNVSRGPIANVEMGVEVKILAKAMIKQIDRVKNDLLNQAREFKKSDRRAIVAAIVGINHAPLYRSFEGSREFPTDGSTYKHPIQEAAAATQHIEGLRGDFDELLILPFRVSNLDPFPFEWVDSNRTRQDYASFLVRLSGWYEQRF